MIALIGVGIVVGSASTAAVAASNHTSTLAARDVRGYVSKQEFMEYRSGMWGQAGPQSPGIGVPRSERDKFGSAIDKMIGACEEQVNDLKRMPFDDVSRAVQRSRNWCESAK
jgi:hypothetical protein